MVDRLSKLGGYVGHVGISVTTSGAAGGGGGPAADAAIAQREAQAEANAVDPVDAAFTSIGEGINDASEWVGDHAVQVAEVAGGAVLIATGIGTTVGLGLVGAGVGGIVKSEAAKSEQKKEQKAAAQQKAAAEAQQKAAAEQMAAAQQANRSLLERIVDWVKGLFE